MNVGGLVPIGAASGRTGGGGGVQGTAYSRPAQVRSDTEASFWE